LAIPAEAATLREPLLARAFSHRWVRRAVALGSGALLNLAFAPYQLWPLAVLCPAILMLLWEGTRPREAAVLGFWFNFGTFLFGTWWIYTGVHTMAAVPAWIALFLLFGLTSIMAAYHAVLGYVVARWLPASGTLRWLVALPAAWLFVEWWRGWFLSGFMWLSVGYTQTDTWLAHLAPIVGVYGISAVVLLASGALIALLRGDTRTRAIAAAVIVVPWLVAAPLGRLEFTEPSGKPVQVAIVQGAIPQDEKWAKENEANVLGIYRNLAEQAFGTPVIVFPEASLPPIANEIMDYLVPLYRDAEAKGSALVLGILRGKVNAEGTGYSDYYNSVLALDLKASEELQWYDKSHLVPFTEFFPVPKIVRKWMLVMNLPYSDFTRGAVVQPPLRAGGLSMSASICYEDGYGSAFLEQLKTADTLVNVTNDAWVGHGSARYLHFQIARMRAIEAQRYMLRAGNDGISAVIGPRGEIVAEAPGFVPYVLRSEVTPRMGLPPYARVGNWLVISLAALGVVLGFIAARRGRKAAP
jgi:apolipoprotein N-acyltransferase